MQNIAPLRPRWNSGQLCVFSGLDGATSYHEGLVAKTTPNGLAIVAPGPASIVFESIPGDNITFGGDFFRFEGSKGLVQCALLDGYHLLLSGAVSVETCDESVSVISRDGKLLAGVTSKFRPELFEKSLEEAMQERGRWLYSQQLPVGLPDITRRTVSRALGMMKGQVYSPEGKVERRWTTPDRWPHKDMWLWDSGFHAIGWRHLDPVLAREMIDAMFDAQAEDGFLCHRVAADGPASTFTQPPVLAYSARLVNEAAADWGWIEELYPKLCAYVEWDLANRDSDGAGLAEWFIEEDPVCRSGESGMDNSPRFDCAHPLDAVDFNAFLALECETLAGFARYLGRGEEAIKWADRHRRICALINDRLWSEEQQFYCDFDTRVGKLSPVLSSAGFLPLVCGAVSEERAEILARHLQDPETFGTKIPVPSIAVRNECYYSKDMWRGPMWININWLIARGLERYGKNAMAAALDRASMAEIERTCEKFGTFFEYFDDRGETNPPELLRKGMCAPEVSPYRQVIHEFGWTATLYVDMVFSRRG